MEKTVDDLHWIDALALAFIVAGYAFFISTARVAIRPYAPKHWRARGLRMSVRNGKIRLHQRKNQ